MKFKIAQLSKELNVGSPSLRAQAKRLGVNLRNEFLSAKDLHSLLVVYSKARKGRNDDTVKAANSLLKGTTKPVLSKPKAITKINAVIEKVEPVKENTVSKSKLLQILPVLPIPMLGLAASYGVYFFSRVFVPDPVAIIEAMAFELVYIGLATMDDLDDSKKKEALIVSIGAVIVSIVYNTLAGALEVNKDLFSELTTGWFWMIAVIHAVPVPVLAFLMSRLKFHHK